MADFRGQKGEQREVALAIPQQGVHNPKGVSTEEEQLPYPNLAPTVCFGLKQTRRPRNWCLKITCGWWLDYLSTLVVMLNCVTLGMYQPRGTNSCYIQILECFIFGYFVMEMLIKMVALGVFGYKGSYLSNHWNTLDVFINSGELLNFFLVFLGINLPFCQVLRPLRLISRVSSLQDLVTLLLDTVPMLANVLILYMFIVHVFGIVGVQLWAGQLLNRCFLEEDIPTKYNVSLSPYYMSKYEERFPFICSPENENGMLHCDEVPPYVVDGETCSMAAPHHASAANESVRTVAGASTNTCVNWNMYYTACHAGDQNPHKGAINFDNIGFSWIAIFQVVTLEGWAEIMFFVMDTHSFWNFVFFILVTIMGSFIIMNVCAVVIATQFLENMEKDIGEQHAGTVWITSISEKFTSWMQKGSTRCNRRSNQVHHYSSKRGNKSILVNAWTPVKIKLEIAVGSKLFERVIMFVVFLSVLTLAIEHHEQPKELTRVIQISNIIFTVVFVVEMALKLLALSWTGYFMDRNNLLDFFIVFISVLELTINGDGRLSILRAFRLLRFVRLVYFLPYLKCQLLVLKRTMEEAASLCGLLLFVTFIFSVLGMHLFGGTFTSETENGDNTQRSNFDTLLWSMVTVFQILTQEDWNLVLYNAMSATSPWAALYFTSVIVLGKHVILNVLVGIVVQSFQARRTSNDNQDQPVLPPDPIISTAVNKAIEEDAASPNTNEDKTSLTFIQKLLRWCQQREDWSFYVLSPQNRFRLFCKSLICHKWFDHVILLFILLSCVAIALERPGIEPKSTERWILNMSRYVFSIVFLIEMFFKVLALGLLFGKDSYCRSSWNVVDGSLVILSLVHIVVSLASTGKNNMLGILKVLRLLRTLRPLRVIKRAPKLKLAVEALIASVKPIGKIVLICCAFFLFYGILGVQLFKGKFYNCVGEDTRNITNKTDCESANYHWERKVYNFDNLLQALVSLFVMYSKDGWVNIMYDGLDAVGVDRQPVRNYNEWMLIFFIPFMIMSFVLLDMFIGVMVETFHECQQEQKKRDLVLLNGGGELQNQCRGTKKMPYYTHYSPIRRFIHTMCTSKFLDLFMTVIIFISVLMMAFEHYNQPQYIKKITEYSYFVFTAILIIEVVLKLVAFGVLRFIKISWNLLDVAIVVISILSIVFNEMKMAHAIPINPSILRVCRVLRLAQVLKAKKIRVLLKTIIKTLSQVGNICLLFMFFFFIYAALGVELFSKLECTNDYPCVGLHRYANFRHFGMALLTLYQICTGDNWSGIMKDTLRECRPGDDGCLSYLSWVAPICFITFVVMAQFVLVNLVVAAIMQALEESNEKTPTNFCLPPEEEEVQIDNQDQLSPSPSSSSHINAERPE